MVYDEACQWCWTPQVALNIAVPHLQWSKSYWSQMFSFNHLWSPKVIVIKKNNPPGSSSWLIIAMSISVYSHNSRGALCLLVPLLIPVGVHQSFYNAGLHHFLKRVSTVTVTQVPAHRGQPKGWNSWTSGPDRWTGPSQIRTLEEKSVIFCETNLRRRVDFAAFLFGN